MHIVVPAKDHATTQSQVGDVSDFSVIACTVYRDRSTFTPARSLSNSRSAGTCTPPSLSSSSSPASWPWQVRCRRKQRLRRTRSLFQACAAKYPAARLPVRDWSKAVKGFVNFCAVLQCADLNQMTFDLWVVVDGSWAVESCSQSEKVNAGCGPGQSLRFSLFGEAENAGRVDERRFASQLLSCAVDPKGRTSITVCSFVVYHECARWRKSKGARLQTVRSAAFLTRCSGTASRGNLRLRWDVCMNIV